MWIRSQDKKTLVNVDNVSSIGIFTDDEAGTICIGATVDESSLDLGFYNTEQVAMGVMDAIELCTKYPEMKLYDMPPMATCKLWGDRK